MAVRYQLLMLVAVALLAASPIQAKSIDNSNSSMFNQIIPSFKSHSLFDLSKWFEGISSFFPKPSFASFPRIEDVNGTKVWTLNLNVEGFKVSDLNATRKGLALQVVGVQVNEHNQTREIVYQQTLPLNGELEELKTVLKDQKLTITVPLKEAKTVQIPIKVDGDLKFKPQVKSS